MRVALIFILWPLSAGHLVDVVSSEPVYCLEGERQMLKKRLMETTHDISTYPKEKSNRRLARNCLWEIQVPRDHYGGLLLQMRHRDRPVHVGNDSMANLSATLYRNGIKTTELQWNATVFKYIWMNWTDQLKLRLTVDNASAMSADNSLYLFVSFATNKSCSDGSQLQYNKACYLVYRPNRSDVEFNSREAVPVELVPTFDTVGEFLGFLKIALGLLKTHFKLLIPGMTFCNGTLMRLIRTDAGAADGGANGAQCQWYPMEGNISSVQWATAMTHSSCNFLVLEQSTEQPPAAVLRCVTDKDAASQLPALLDVPSSQRRVAKQPAPNNTSLDCGSLLSSVIVPSCGETEDKPKLVISLTVAGVLIFLLVVVAALAIGWVWWYRRSRRAERSNRTASNGISCVGSSENGHGVNDRKESMPLNEIDSNG